MNYERVSAQSWPAARPLQRLRKGGSPKSAHRRCLQKIKRWFRKLLEIAFGGQKENLGLSGFFFSLQRFGRLNCSDRSMKLRKEGLPEAGRVSAKFLYRVPMFVT
jgi:hypothetical protein